MPKPDPKAVAATEKKVRRLLGVPQTWLNEGNADASDSTGNDAGVIIDDHIKKGMEDRGWTEKEIQDLAKTEPAGTSRDQRSKGKTDDGQGRDDPATVFGTKDRHIVVNDRTREVTQISNKNKSNWIPDSRIQWNGE